MYMGGRLCMAILHILHTCRIYHLLIFVERLIVCSRSMSMIDVTDRHSECKIHTPRSFVKNLPGPERAQEGGAKTWIRGN